jgi:hypothetical protein
MKRNLNVWTDPGFSEKHFVTQKVDMRCILHGSIVTHLSKFPKLPLDSLLLNSSTSQFHFNVASNDGIKGWSNSAKITNTYHKACVNHLGFFPNNIIRSNSTMLGY